MDAPRSCSLTAAWMVCHQATGDRQRDNSAQHLVHYSHLLYRWPLLLLLLQISRSQADTGANHAVSALKFGILKKFVMLGWAVLLSDIDVCVLQDPFKHLYRCAAWAAWSVVGGGLSPMMLSCSHICVCGCVWVRAAGTL
jgi:hypothetical protein